ncbi:hypothetical protein YC2023_040689 [Brassica napus]
MALGFSFQESFIFKVSGISFVAVVKKKKENMAYAAMKPTKAGLEEPLEQIHKIRITLSSKNVKNLEKGPVVLDLNFMNQPTRPLPMLM